MFRLTPHGVREMLIGSLILAALAGCLFAAWRPAALAVLPLWVWLFAFFRDPDRPIPDAPGAMVSPADGRVTDIVRLDHCELLDAPATRIGIFLSVFDVHVNRMPCDGRVLTVTHRPGAFVNAMSHEKASAANEAMTVVIAGDDGLPAVAVRQIAGLIARRIVCTVAPGQTVARGQRMGMIKFGSRTELFIADRLGPRPTVRVGQKVRGGADVIATVSPQAAPAPAAR